MTGSAVCVTTACFSGSRSTGKERDTESGLDYFMARYYSSSMGRFISPDWSTLAWNVPYSDLSNPQSLNLYVYGANNPLRFKDLDGHMHQECGQQTSSINANGDTVVNANCSNVPDFWDYQWWGNHAQSAARHAQQTWHSVMKFASSPRGKLLERVS